MNGLATQLRWAMALAFVLALAGMAAGWYGSSLHGAAAAVNTQALARAEEAQQRLGSVYTERREIDEYLPRYATLRTLGALDNENRLDWIERVTAIRDELRLPGLAYTVEPRQPYAPLPSPGAGLRFEASRMRLEFAAIHEGDLLRIIDRLRTPAIGVFEARGCTLSRDDTGGAPPPDQAAALPTLSGACLLDWVSLAGATAPAAQATPAVPAGGPPR